MRFLAKPSDELLFFHFIGQNNSTNATTANPFPRKETGEYRLKKSLFNDYDAEIIPSKIDGKAIEVRFEIALHQILEIVIMFLYSALAVLLFS